MDAKRFIFAAAITASATLVLVAGCGSASSNDVELTAARVPAVSQTRAVDAIARAHCTHVYRCNELGGSHRFEDFDSCTRAVRRESLASPMCNHDIDAAKLTSCLDAIRTSGCDLPRSARFSACRDEDVCR